MKFSTVILSNVLLAGAALGAALAPPPSSAERFALRRERRAAERALWSTPLSAVEGNTVSNGRWSNSSNVQLSSNWGGVVIESPPSGTTFKKVTGKFTVPSPTKGAGSSSSQAASAWVGIDGDTYSNAILQTGVDFTWDSGSVSFDAWYEWYPAYAYDFSGMSISAGDEILLTVTASTTTAGTAVIENTSTGKTVTKSLSNSHALGGKNAEWIVEDFEEGSSLVPLCDFGTVRFTDAIATTRAGTTEGPSAGSIIEIENSAKNVVAKVSDVTSSGLVVTYV